jgi:uncharacterized damage-inducible protein DinB
MTTSVPRPMLVTTGSEREILDAWLDFHRSVVIGKVSGVDAAAASRRHVPSQTTLAGLVRHLAVTEREWFQQTVAGKLPASGEGPEDPDTSWDVDENEDLQGLVQAYEDECARSRAVAAERGLDEVVVHPQLGEVSVRWVLVHVIEETARHAGHADILRELTDGSIGVV